MILQLTLPGLDRDYLTKAERELVLHALHGQEIRDTRLFLDNEITQSEYLSRAAAIEMVVSKIKH